MGIDYAAFHHESRTFVRLWRGGWKRLDYDQPLLSLVADAVDESGGLRWRDSPREHVLQMAWLCARIQTFLRTGRWEAGPSEGPMAGEVLADYDDAYFLYIYGEARLPGGRDASMAYREIGVLADGEVIDYEGESLLSSEEVDLIVATAED